MAPFNFRRSGSQRYSLSRQQTTSPEGLNSSRNALIAVTVRLQGGLDFVQAVQERQEIVILEPRKRYFDRHPVFLRQFNRDPFRKRMVLLPVREVEHDRHPLFDIASRTIKKSATQLEQGCSLAGSGLAQDEQ